MLKTELMFYASSILYSPDVHVATPQESAVCPRGSYFGQYCDVLCDSVIFLRKTKCTLSLRIPMAYKCFWFPPKYHYLHTLIHISSQAYLC